MALNQQTLTHLRGVLGARDTYRIQVSAGVADAMERKWKRRFDKVFETIINGTLNLFEWNGPDYNIKGNSDWIFSEIAEALLEHELDVTTYAARTATLPEYVAIEGVTMAAQRAPAWPSDTVRIRTLWDRWRRTGKLPGRTAAQAAAVKALYIRRVQTLMQQRASEFIAGKPKAIGYNDKGTIWNPEAFDRAGAKRAIEDEARVSRARASTIIETETTRYYNTTRVNTYNAIDTVVGYYFICVRDHATTEWCLSRRHAVLMKTSPLLKRNTPPCHYNCRSELLPLSRLNPAHMKLLNDMSLRAENRVFVPLPPGWNQ